MDWTDFEWELYNDNPRYTLFLAWDDANARIIGAYLKDTDTGTAMNQIGQSAQSYDTAFAVIVATDEEDWDAAASFIVNELTPDYVLEVLGVSYEPSMPREKLFTAIGIE